MKFLLLRSIVCRICQSFLRSVLIIILLLNILILCLFYFEVNYEIIKDLERNFVDSEIDYRYWSDERVRPSEVVSPTAAEIAKRIEEQKRVLNLKMSAYV